MEPPPAPSKGGIKFSSPGGVQGVVIPLWRGAGGGFNYDSR
jgi:hypothetical protein